MTGRERVTRAIEFGHPDRIPVFATDQSDVVRLSYVDPTGWKPRERPPGDFLDEWGSLWYSCDATEGNVKRPAIAGIEAADAFVLPDPHLPARWAHFDEQVRRFEGCYLVGNAQYLCFDRLTFLLGDLVTLEALLQHQAELGRLMARLIDFEIAIVDELADRGVHGIRFWDDVGAGRGVIMGPALWRDMLKPHYRRIFEHIRGRGLHVHWHSCGNCLDILDDLIEIGCAVFSLGEPFMMGVGALSRGYRGRVCFECSPDNRTVLSTGDHAAIEAAIAGLIDGLATPAGGLVLIAARDNFDCIDEDIRRFTVDAVLRARHASR